MAQQGEVTQGLDIMECKLKEKLMISYHCYIHHVLRLMQYGTTRIRRRCMATSKATIKSTSTRETVYIALGSNLGDRAANLHRAIAALKQV